MMGDKKRGKGPHKANKVGRNGRTAKHKAGALCGKKNCSQLSASRVFNTQIGAFIPRGATLPRDISAKAA